MGPEIERPAPGLRGRRATPSRWVGGALGLLSAGVALGSAELAAGAIGEASSPMIAVGGAAIDATPEWLKSFAIRTFGPSDKAVLLAGIALVIAVTALIVGVLSMRRPSLGVGALVAFGAIGAVSAATRPANGLGDTIPSVVGVAIGAGAYLLLRRAAGIANPRGGSRTAAAPPLDGDALRSIRGFDRRRFLEASAAAAGLAVVGGGLGRLLVRRADASASRAGATIPPPADPAPPLPGRSDLQIPGLEPFITPNGSFYRVDTALFVPAVDAEGWRLEVHGMVAREITLDYRSLLARPLIERDVTLACVSNEVGGVYIGNARWIGAPLKDLLEEAGVHPGATQLVSRSSDGFTIGTPTQVVMDGRDAMLAVAMNGEPLPLEHGFPVRMIVPGLYGYVSATKWVVDLELTTLDAYDAYWVQRGWAKEAPIKTQSRIDVPRSSSKVQPGQVVVAGVAWAQHRGISRVEIRIDDGPWDGAELADEDTIDTWRQWVYPWQASPGQHRISVRATDGQGQPQPAERSAPFPDGATGHHTISVQVG